MTTTVLAAIPSPAQGVWHIGSVPIRAYALCIIAGIVAALIIGDRRWEARGGERGVIYDIALWAVPFGLIGGRLYHVITDWWRYFGDNGAGLAGVFRIWDGGLGIWGAVALGGVGAWIACRRRGIPLPAFGDAIAPGIILAQGIGRIGNYFNQELYGAETKLLWALKIYERRDSAGMIDNLNGVSTGEVVHLVHPTFLYELLWNLLVFAILIYVDRRFKFGHGRLFALYVAAYCLGRFWIELLRVDDATLIDGVRINSFTATFVFIGAVVYIMAAPKGREDPATLKGKARQESSTVEELTEGLAAATATTGVVAAAKAAAAEDEESEPTVEAEALHADVAEGEEIPAEEVSAEELGADVAGVPADSLEEAEEFAAEGDEESQAEPAAEVEAVAEAESLAEDVAEAPAEEIVEAEEFAEAGGAADVGGVGAVEGEEASDALVDAVEAHESAVEGEAVAEELADEAAAGTAAEQPVRPRRLRMWPKRRRRDKGEAEPAAVFDETLEGEEPADEVAPEASGVSEAVAEAESLAEDVAEAPAEEIVEAEEFAEAGGAADVGGVGVVEGEEASDALVDAVEAHESAVEGEAVAGELAAEVADVDVQGDEESGDADAGDVGAVEDEEASDALVDADENDALAEALADEAEAMADEAAGAESTDEAAEVTDVGVQGDEESADADAGDVDAAEAHESAVEGEIAAGEWVDTAAEASAAEPAEATEVEDAEAEPAARTPAKPADGDGGRVRKWLRRRRNR